MKRRPRPYFQRAIDDAAKRIIRDIEQQGPRRFHPGGIVRGLDLDVVATDPPPLPTWRHPLYQDRELIEVTTLGQRGVQYVEGPCRHSQAVPVESVLGELVAWLCPGCDEQLPAGWRNA